MQNKTKIMIALLLVIGFAGCSNNDNSAAQAQYAAMMRAYLASATASSTSTAVLFVTATTIVTAPVVATSTTVGTSVTTITPAVTGH